jgi:predicted DNA-binding transcriptional regulator AlpA
MGAKYSLIPLLTIPLFAPKRRGISFENQKETTTNIHWLSRKEFTLYLHVSLSTIDRGIRNNTFPFNRHIKIGARILFPSTILTDLEKMAKSGSELTGGKV